MTRLYDNLRRTGVFSEDSNLIKFIPETTVIDVTNVFELGVSAPPPSTIGMSRIPPFSVCFLEYVDLNVDTKPWYGALWLTLKIIKNSKKESPFTGRKIDRNAKWMCACFFYIWVFNKGIRLPVECECDFDEQGHVIDDYFEYAPILSDGVIPKSYYDNESLRMASTMTVDVSMVAFSLMAAKNVKLYDHHPPPKLSKSHEKKYGEPLVTYKTIKVNPMRTVQRMDGDDVPSSERDATSKEMMPLHIVAGNFADYRDGPGLFGKPELKGVFWRPQHVRGTAKRGVVIKDYEVEAPESGDE